MKMKCKTKKIFKNISLCLLGLGAIGAIGVGATKIVEHVKDDTKTLSLSYEVGGLDTTSGKYEDVEDRLYTKEKFACEGLKATLDFDSVITYQIFYYDILDNYISSTDILTEGYSGLAPLNGAYARVMITPTNDEDDKISFTEKYTYSKQLNVKVNKDAESNVKNKFVSIGTNLFTVVDNLEDSVFELKKIWGYESEKFITSADSVATTKTILKIDNFKSVSFKNEADSGLSGINSQIYCYSKDMKFLGKHETYPYGNTYELPKGSYYCILSVYSPDATITNVKSVFTFSK